MVVIAACREERGLVPHALHLVEAENVAVEAERAVDVRDLQVDVPDVDSGIDAHRATIASGEPEGGLLPTGMGQGRPKSAPLPPLRPLWAPRELNR